jgi:hypothetical protein
MGFYTTVIPCIVAQEHDKKNHNLNNITLLCITSYLIFPIVYVTLYIGQLLLFYFTFNINIRYGILFIIHSQIHSRNTNNTITIVLLKVTGKILKIFLNIICKHKITYL